MPREPDQDLQSEIDEIRNFESDRPTPVEIHFDGPGSAPKSRSMRPKLPDSWAARVVAVIIALGAIAEVIHQLLTK